jgi:hypothetical protein
MRRGQRSLHTEADALHRTRFIQPGVPRVIAEALAVSVSENVLGMAA